MGKFKRLTALVLIFSLTWLHAYPVVAGDNISYSNDGQAFGRSAMPDFNAMVSTDAQNRTLSISSGDGVYDLDTSAMFPEAERSTPIDYDSLFGDDAGIVSAAGTIEGELREENSYAGMAYQSIRDASNSPPPSNFRDDPLWEGTKETLGNVFSDEFNECTTTSTYNPSQMVSHVPDYQTCQRVKKPAGGCEVYHTVGIEGVDFNVYISAQGRTWLTVEFDLKNGTWTRVDPSDASLSVKP